MAKPDRNTQTPPSGECGGCAALRAQVADLLGRVNALATATLPLPRCTCGLLVTRHVHVSHPVGGLTVHALCDKCPPVNTYFDDSATVSELPVAHAHAALAANAAVLAARVH